MKNILKKIGHFLTFGIFEPLPVPRKIPIALKSHDLTVSPNHINTDHEPVAYTHRIKYHVMSKDQKNRRKKGKYGRLQNKKRMLQSKK